MSVTRLAAILTVFVVLFALPVSALIDTATVALPVGEFAACIVVLIGGLIIGWLIRDASKEE